MSHDLPSGSKLRILEEKNQTMNLVKTNITLLTAFFCCGAGFCSSSHGHKIYRIGDSIKWNADYGELIATVTAKKAIYSKDDDDDENCQIYITYSVATAKEFQLDYKTIKLLYNYSSDESYTDIERTVEKNGYNIFETTVSEDIEYTFCFNMPFDPYFKQYIDDPNEKATSIMSGVWASYYQFTLWTDDIYKATINEE